MLPPTPRSPLFPYTTLFRSLVAPHERRALGLAAPARHGRASVPPFFDRKRGGGAAPRLRSKDRKSTRLNSSHQIISYAVFCLKKKKLDQLRRRLARIANSNL